MKIKNISCIQFAGIRNRNIDLADGINVIYGKNESGKSTLVNLISRTFFQNSRIDNRTDKEFKEQFFPSAYKDGTPAGDFIDGKIHFETENGGYTISKEWGDQPRCLLITPRDPVRDQGRIDEILREALRYGEGVYTNLLFSSQRNAGASLQTVLDDISEKNITKKALTDALSKAFSESDGISAEAIEQAINAKIDEIVRKHWDIERAMPERKVGGGRHQKEVGEILKAYYALEDAKAVLEKISLLEAEADRTANDYLVKADALHRAKEAVERFNTFERSLTLQSERKKTIEGIEKQLVKINSILADWPVIEENFEKAMALQKEKINRELLDKYNIAKKIADEINLLEKEIAGLPNCPEDEEIKQVEMAQKNILTLENKLCGMNLNAIFKMFGENTVEITTLRAGAPINVTEGNVNITEAIKVVVPGVMEMELAPANVNTLDIETQISQKKKTINDIFAKYKVDSTEALKDIASKINALKIKVDAAKERLDMLLGESSFETLEFSVKSMVDTVLPKDEIENKILLLCGTNTVADFIVAKKTQIEGYISDYGSIGELKAHAYDLQTELINSKSLIETAEDIPTEYVNISDPQAYAEELKDKLKMLEENYEFALAEKTAAVSNLENYRENIPYDPTEQVLKAERRFNEQQALLNHWLNIAEVFKAQKEKVQDNPLQDITDKFTEYLNVISDGRVLSEFPMADKLNMNIYSNDRLLDYSKLSEGTKETVLFAFKLAVLDHLFPEGGGVIVLDDPFTDMDAERVKKSCELVKVCAARHQVIFLTCREEYASLLGVNSITL